MSIVRRTLVLGGTRSGKSAYAEALAAEAPVVRYVATGRRIVGDADWNARLDAHRARRPSEWSTVESSDGLAVTLHEAHPGTTIVDDLGTWLTSALDDADAWDLPRGTVAPATDALCAAVQQYRGDLVLVSPEVGWGVVPATRSGRLFQDEMGTLNSRLAATCETVVLVVAGLPLPLKSDNPKTDDDSGSDFR
ncbi:bifunctional adenosylcobinamide kinase/adenosylcobinamide-phosphate guanylyltransferase [Rhodococcus sp. 14-2470-1b]|uniref:bifunctional adenosylcobinamide kinase/adenosylcobinamide-phosphate guanylyltransferase n=1 Tax=Rhodococcus sp. 14-2470-1b TaxID=2023149 RepID=UPI000B9C1EDA|nr:bifunctional adenosylcobinamide kinase/adenosylcobinamide-phosphate guanylyltransferase [Rhodococcus sp. 14-2470-1b]OZF46098.1 bifunctional adenosylcobinamide kinase/adenosylcobinamide-phosphate guanylyltransferase [Rhodococcus sp. 14-2470-1b]